MTEIAVIQVNAGLAGATIYLNANAVYLPERVGIHLNAYDSHLPWRAGVAFTLMRVMRPQKCVRSKSEVE